MLFFFQYLESNTCTLVLQSPVVTLYWAQAPRALVPQTDSVRALCAAPLCTRDTAVERAFCGVQFYGVSWLNGFTLTSQLSGMSGGPRGSCSSALRAAPVSSV